MLTAKQSRFASEYAIDLNATQSAIRAGYSQKTAYSQGQRLLKKVDVVRVVDLKQKELATRNEVTRDEIVGYLREAIRLAQEAQALRGDGSGCMQASAGLRVRCSATSGEYQ